MTLDTQLLQQHSPTAFDEVPRSMNMGVVFNKETHYNNQQHQELPEIMVIPELLPSTSTSQLTVAHGGTIFCENLQSPVGPILTGIGFLDHMLDQFHSHAQIGLSMMINTTTENAGELNHTTTSSTTTTMDQILQRNRLAHVVDQRMLMDFIGTQIGIELRRLILESGTTSNLSRFGCPLDEALVVCTLKRSGTSTEPGQLTCYSLSPYGKHPSPTIGRQHLGQMETAPLIYFWTSLAKHSGLWIGLDKICGLNAHHIVEASFKAFCRALRNLLDGISISTTNTSSPTEAPSVESFYGQDTINHKASLDLHRHGRVDRKTKETAIAVQLQLDGGLVGGVQINTGISTLDIFLTELAQAANMSLHISCIGDLWIDEHHTAEDVAIALGQVLNEALGDRSGLNRMWWAAKYEDQHPGTEIEVIMDLSNRPGLFHNLNFMNNSQVDGPMNEEKIDDLSFEMIEHVFESLVMNARMTVHIRQATHEKGKPSTLPTRISLLQAAAVAFGRAFKYCAMVDSRRAGSTASSKGTLSV